MRSADPTYVAALKLALYNDVDLPDFQSAANLLTPDDPVQPFAALTHRTLANWGSVPRSYIRTSKDNALPTALQTGSFAGRTHSRSKTPTKVYDIDSGHSPFISRPRALADTLLAVASARGDEALLSWAR